MQLRHKKAACRCDIRCAIKLTAAENFKILCRESKRMIVLILLLSIWIPAQGFANGNVALHPFKHGSLKLENATPCDLEAGVSDCALEPKLEGENSRQPWHDPQSVQVNIGGLPASPQQFPWTVYIWVDDFWMCVGSLIAADWVLTAAHCVQGGSSFVVSAGGIDLSIMEPNEKTQTSNVTFIHENYNSSSLANDIAIIRLPIPFKLDHNINIIRLPKQSESKETFAATRVTASGYRVDSNQIPTMHYVTMTVMQSVECADHYGKQITQSIMCATNDTGTVCDGDTGGPLMRTERDGLYTQIGIVSFSARHGSCAGSPSGFTRVTSYLEWIATTTGIEIRK